MRNLLLLIVVVSVCSGFYIYEKQPALWDRLMKLAANAQQSGVGIFSTLGQNSSLQSGQSPAAPVPSAPEFIAPSTTTFVSTPHVRDVPQTDDPPTFTKVFTPPNTLPAQPNWTWTTTDGKHIYRNVVVCKVEPDCVTILDDDGGAMVNIANLPPDIQKQLNYDPDQAAQAMAARQAQEKASQVALAAEQQKAQEIAQQNTTNTDANDASIMSAAAKQKASEDAHARVAEAQVEIDDLQDDLDSISREVSIDPRTGQYVGSAFFVKKYKDDKEKISELQQIVSSGGKQGSP